MPAFLPEGFLVKCYFAQFRPIPQDSLSCYDSAMRNLVVLLIHLIATLARLLGPGGVRSLVAKLRDRKPNLFNAFEIFDHTHLTALSPSQRRLLHPSFQRVGHPARCRA